MEILLFLFIVIGFVILIAGASVSRSFRRRSRRGGASSNNYIYGDSSSSNYSSSSGGDYSSSSTSDYSSSSGGDCSDSSSSDYSSSSGSDYGVFSIGDKLSFQDLQGRELAFIQQRLLSWGSIYEIYRNKSLYMACQQDNED